MRLNIEETIKSIKTELEISCNVNILLSGRKPWSGLVKQTFIKLAISQNCRACCSLSEVVKATLTPEEQDAVNWGEWLYDLVWYTSVIDKYENRDIERTTSIPLVMECEWDATLDAIALDFDKLLVANADLRVMVCGGYKNFPSDAIIEQCKRAVQTYEQGHIGDTFLVCIVPEEGDPECTEIIRR